MIVFYIILILFGVAAIAGTHSHNGTKLEKGIAGVVFCSAVICLLDKLKVFS